MPNDLLQWRRWTFRAHGQRMLFVRGRSERPTHVIMKAFLWALYLPTYPALSIEVSIGDRYKPDVISLDQLTGKPLFWGESGHVGRDKIQSLVRRYRETHFAIAKWGMRLEPLMKIVADALEGIPRQVPFDLITFHEDSLDRFIDADGNLTLAFDDLEWIRFEPTHPH
jgi:hypothetical protein